MQEATGVATLTVVGLQVVCVQLFPAPAVPAVQEATRVGPVVIGSGLGQVTVNPPLELGVQAEPVPTYQTPATLTLPLAAPSVALPL